MKQLMATMIVALSGCTVLPTPKGTGLAEPACSASCSAQFERCPQMFSAFPERGAIECPAARQQCLRACAKNQAPASVAPAALLPASAALSREDKLRELKRFHDEGLISDEVYIDRQRAILTEP